MVQPRTPSAHDDDPTAAAQICEIVVTADDTAWLREFTAGLVGDRLVACGQIGEVRSTYRWQGAVEHATEARVALHTRRSLIGAVAERVRAEHPYDTACVIALPVIGGSDAYTAWVIAETRAPDAC